MPPWHSARPKANGKGSAGDCGYDAEGRLLARSGTLSWNVSGIASCVRRIALLGSAGPCRGLLAGQLRERRREDIGIIAASLENVPSESLDLALELCHVHVEQPSTGLPKLPGDHDGVDIAAVGGLDDCAGDIVSRKHVDVAGAHQDDVRLLAGRQAARPPLIPCRVGAVDCRCLQDVQNADGQRGVRVTAMPPRLGYRALQEKGGSITTRPGMTVARRSKERSATYL